MQAISDQGLHCGADMAFKLIDRAAFVDAQRELGLQQVLHRAAIQRFFNAENIHRTAEVVHVPVQQASDQARWFSVLEVRLDGYRVQPEPIQPRRTADLRRLVAEVGAEPLFLMIFLRCEVGMTFRSPAKEALQPFKAGAVAVFGFGLAHDRRLSDQVCCKFGQSSRAIRAVRKSAMCRAHRRSASGSGICMVRSL